jgi:hypothetical protein
MLTVVERRKTPRVNLVRQASVSFGVATIAECSVLNTSMAGACLEFRFRPVLPKNFSVVIKPEYVRHFCRVVWQSGTKVGVRFRA